MISASLKKWLTRPPALFPWVALFHLVITAHAIWSFIGEPLESWVHPVCLALYTLLWFFICGMKRWAALGYVALTSINLLLHFLWAKEGTWFIFSGALFPVDVLFSFFILVYYKRFS